MSKICIKCKLKIYYENKLLTVNVDDIESIIIPAQHCGAVLVRESAQKVENVLEFDRKKKNHSCIVFLIIYDDIYNICDICFVFLENLIVI